jgi:CRISPR-associated endonuclease Csn1
MKTVLGLDLGTNSIGWALTQQNFNEKQGEILGIGSRIIPMDAAMMGDFEKGNKVSQTAERTQFRSVRRLRERELLRRERLHRVLNIIGFLPQHYSNKIDFEKNFGQFKINTEPKLAYKQREDGKAEFIFKNSFDEMIVDFMKYQPELVSNNKKIPYDWTIYYLRKKALSEKVEREELAWLLLNFNQKRGYFQLRGEEDDDPTRTAQTRIYFLSEKIESVIDTKVVYKGLKIFKIKLSNGETGKYFSKVEPDWLGLEKSIIVTIDTDKDGVDRLEEDGTIRKKFAIPTDEDWDKKWKLIKIKTEETIKDSGKTIGSYIYDTLLKSPNQKIKGKLVRVIERNFYKTELEQILKKQKEFHPELKDEKLYLKCIEELYPHNDNHFKNIEQRDLSYLFSDDIIFYQRPLKSKKSLISDCQYERRFYVDKETKETKQIPIKCIAKSHPLFQEFRLWQFIHNLRIYDKDNIVNGNELDVTSEFLKSEDDYSNLFSWLNDKKEIEQKSFLKYPGLGIKKNAEKYRWNYVEDKLYPCNKTRNLILNKLAKKSKVILTQEIEIKTWHLLYSITSKAEIDKALTPNLNRKSDSKSVYDLLLDNKFTVEEISELKKITFTEKDYGSYSEKAIKKLLPLMRRGSNWDLSNVLPNVKSRVEAIIERLKEIDFEEIKIEEITDDDIPRQLLKSFAKLKDVNPLQGLNTYQACYAVYGRHSEASETLKWENPESIDYYLKTVFQQGYLRNPIVEQIIKETLKVISDIWKYYGKGKPNFFDEIHIELGREMKNPADKRKAMSDQVNANENTNIRIKSLIAELKNDSNYLNVRPYSPSQQEILRIYEEGVLKSNIEIPDDIGKILKTSQPSKSELVRYKLWLEQKYRSPYTGEVIELSKLFTPAYEIEHIIPQSRYFDDSLSNKVICESEVNKDKDNCTAFQYIRTNPAKIIELSFGKKVKLFSLDAYEAFVKDSYANNRSKMKKLLMLDIPDSFVERQLNDTRYISKVVKNLLSNIVRQDGEEAVTSKNVIACNGNITSILKHDWGLNDIWNDIISPRFQRMNELTKSEAFGKWENKEGKRVFHTTVPIELSKGFNKKRIDHRHHALDALVIACASRNHINYLNNEYAKEKQSDLRFDLRKQLCEKVFDKVNSKNYKWVFHKPWPTITGDCKQKLQTTIVSFKQNLRVINKTVNYTQQWKKDESGKAIEKIFVKQTKGENWAIRKPLHKDTVKGVINLRFKKTVQLSVAIDNYAMLVDKSLKSKIKGLTTEKSDKKDILKFFKEHDNNWEGKNVSKVEIYYYENNLVASRVLLDITFDESKIECITDTGIQKIILCHLRQDKYQNQKDDNGKLILPESLAFSPEGIDEMNRNIIALNNGKFHQPIYKVRVSEAKGNKFNIGNLGNKVKKYVEAAKGTNLFFAIYHIKNGKRIYNSIPLNVVIQSQMQVGGSQSLLNLSNKSDQEANFNFSLSPNDLVYVPTDEEIENANLVDVVNLNQEQIARVYKMVSSSGNQCFFIQSNVAKSLVDKKEFSALNKMEKSINGDMIKEICIPLKVDRIGNLYKREALIEFPMKEYH